MMEREAIIQKFTTLNLWQRNGQRAPHKPLLVLYAIGKLLRDEDRLIPYSEIDEDLGNLLKEFSPRQSRQGTQYPFWRLQNDSVWDIPHADQITPNSAGDVSRRDLLDNNISGGFHEAIAEQLQSDSTLSFEIIQRLLYIHFPYSIHEDILQAVEIEAPLQIFEPQKQAPKQRKRDPSFRPNILRAYKCKCAVCGFDAKLGTSPIALEAAHIKWHTHYGPDVVVNGLALCSLHHKLFDRGAFTLSPNREIRVSSDVNGSVGFEEWLMKFDGKQINLPKKIKDYPAKKFIRWHVKSVFKGDSRKL